MWEVVTQELILPFVITLVVSLVLTYLVRKAAIKLGWISIPREGRWNVRKVALMGGVAIFLSFAVTFAIFLPVDYIAIGIGALLMFLAGFFDDRFELKPIVKLLIQFLAASILVVFNYTICSTWPFWLAIPLTYLWVVGITNAFNLLDNMDGLAAGVAVITSLILTVLALKLQMWNVALIAVILSGASGGFLFFNYHPAKIFMGDSGSLFIGYVLAALPLILEPAMSSFSAVNVLIVFITVTILPIFDTLFVSVMRIIKGRSPSQGGRDHSSHRLVFSGLSEKTAVHVLYGITALYGAIVLLFFPTQMHLFIALFAISTVGLLLFGRYLSRVDAYEEEELSTIETMFESIPTYLKGKIQLTSIILDIVLIIGSFTLAHIIRFEGWSGEINQAVMHVLPGIIVIKVLILAGAGIYKSVWRYAGVVDLMKLLTATLLGSIVAWLFSWYYSAGYISVTVFVIDWLLFLFLISGSRFAFKGLRRLFSLPTNGGKNVLIYGAGDAGWLALSEIRQNPNLHLDPIGFLDDSPYKNKGKIQGLKILGNFTNLLPVCQEYDVDIVLISIRKLSLDKKEMIKRRCAANDISCREFIPTFDDLTLEKQFSMMDI